MKKLVIFDLDGTLAESKSPIDAEMQVLLQKLLGIMKVAVISGGDWPQFKKQLLSEFTLNNSFNNLFILPTCGTKLYEYNKGWSKLYSEDFSTAEKEKIVYSLNEAAETLDLKTVKTWGDVVEDRGSQITFSALGQDAPLEIKKQWDSSFAKRKKIKAILDNLIPEFSIRLGGTTSIDVTKLGIDKAYGIKKLQDILGIALNEMVFIGDALFPGGNDYPVKEMGVTSIQISNPEETKKIIETIIAMG
jgi:hypothetical protein